MPRKTEPPPRTVTMEDPSLQFTVNYLRKLKGKTVRDVVLDDSQVHDIGHVLGLEFTDGSVAWIQCDPEGNGPGHLNIEPAHAPPPSKVPPV